MKLTRTTISKRFLAAAMRRCAIVAALLVGALSASAAPDYPALAARAQRAYTYSEWASAAALFDLMLEQRPDVADTYGKAITSRAMMADTLAQVALMNRALENHIPFDSVFSAVRTSGFALGKAPVYEHFLSLVANNFQWLRRTVDSYLLRYYCFRRNAPMIVAYSDKMLQGAPDNVGFLMLRADGQMLMGEYERAVDTYRKVLAVDPANVDALLWLGNYYARSASDSADYATLARTFLSQAYALKPTPFVEAALAKLP